MPKLNRFALWILREALRQLHPHAQVPRGDRRMLARGALAVVLAGHHDPAAPFLCPGGEPVVHHVENEGADRRDVASERQDPVSRGHDDVGADVVPDLDEDPALDRLLHLGERGEGLDVGASDHLDPSGILGGLDEPLRIERVHGGVGDLGARPEGAGVGDRAGERRGGGRLGRAEVDRIVLRPAPSLVVAREGAQGVAPRGRGLSHADAPEAAGLVDARPGFDQGQEPAHLGDVLQRLPAALD